MGDVPKLILSSWSYQLLYQCEMQGSKESSHACVSLGIEPLNTCAGTLGCGHAPPLLYLCSAQQEFESSVP